MPEVVQYKGRKKTVPNATDIPAIMAEICRVTHTIKPVDTQQFRACVIQGINNSLSYTLSCTTVCTPGPMSLFGLTVALFQVLHVYRNIPPSPHEHP